MSKRSPRKLWQVVTPTGRHVVTARTAGHAVRQCIRAEARRAFEMVAEYQPPKTDVNTGGWEKVLIACKGPAQ